MNNYDYADCIECHDSVSVHGYPRWSVGNGKSRHAHVLTWEQAQGPVGDRVVHHKCRNKLCINIDHLEAMTAADHIRVHAAEMTECKHGHDWTDGTNVATRPNGYRYCKECNRQRWHDNKGKVNG